MGTPHPAERVKLFIAVMHAPDIDPAPIMSRLNGRFGETEAACGPVAFSWSDYYEPEMGPGLLKGYFCFARTIERGELPGIKLWTNDIEASCSRSGKRSVNIDPGYLARDKLVLATTKDFFHRLYLGQGIYGEVTLHLRDGVYRFFSWTYPDYREKTLHELLFKARASLVGELRRDSHDSGKF
jgi:hypothetical protein